MEKMLVSAFMPAGREISIDDIMTRGATLMGAANRLNDAFPNAHIRAFAAMRTISNSDEFHEMYTPCVGVITYRSNQDDTIRRP